MAFSITMHSGIAFSICYASAFVSQRVSETQRGRRPQYCHLTKVAFLEFSYANTHSAKTETDFKHTAEVVSGSKHSLVYLHTHTRGMKVSGTHAWKAKSFRFWCRIRQFICAWEHELLPSCTHTHREFTLEWRSVLLWSSTTCQNESMSAKRSCQWRIYTLCNTCIGSSNRPIYTSLIQSSHA